VHKKAPGEGAFLCPQGMGGALSSKVNDAYSSSSADVEQRTVTPAYADIPRVRS